MPKRTRLEMRAAARLQQSQNPGYKRRKLGTVVTQGGVPGARAYVPRSIPNRPELKFADITIQSGTGENWQLMSSLSLCSIRQGSGNQERLGRKIRVKAVIFRGTSSIGVASNNAPCPYTMDFIWDKQCNGAVPGVNAIYQSVAPYDLPNPETDERFEFAKRFAINDPNSNFSIVNTRFNCNKIITYDLSTGNITDLTSTNLLVAYTCPFDATPTLIGKLRILYVDE